MANGEDATRAVFDPTTARKRGDRAARQARAAGRELGQCVADRRQRVRPGTRRSGGRRAPTGVRHAGAHRVDRGVHRGGQPCVGHRAPPGSWPPTSTRRRSPSRGGVHRHRRNWWPVATPRPADHPRASSPAAMGTMATAFRALAAPRSRPRPRSPARPPRSAASTGRPTPCTRSGSRRPPRGCSGSSSRSRHATAPQTRPTVLPAGAVGDGRGAGAARELDPEPAADPEPRRPGAARRQALAC